MPVPSINAYRQILARKFPEPFIALLAFVLGVWLWDHYFGKNEGYAPGTDQIAMVKLDRDFRLAESMSGDSEWLRFAVGAETPEAVRLNGIVCLQMLHEEKSLGDRASEAMVVAIAEERGLPLLDTLRQVSGGEDGLDLPIAYDVLVERLTSGQGTWWDRSMLRAYQQERATGPEFAEALKVYDAGTAVLRKRAIAARGTYWGFVILGSLLIPMALKQLVVETKKPAHCYSNRWTAPLGLVVFLVAVLAWIGFDMTLRAGLMAVVSIPPWLEIALDSALRLLPAMIAIGLLFRRPSHAVRVLGLARQPAWVLIFGMFSLLSWVGQGAGMIFGGMSPPDPAGGLSAGEAGYWGLAFAVVSACLMAPIAEEIVYRGVLFCSLRNRFGVLPGAILSSGAFALVHFYNISGLVLVGMFGFVCALVFARTRALSSVIALHCLYNLAVKLPEWLVYHSPLQ
jgi:membrane protease YdiL (CAAX protease family)